MTLNNIYNYANGDLLNNRNIYSYSKFHGAKFLQDWKKSRLNAAKNNKFGNQLVSKSTPTLSLIKSIRSGLLEFTKNPTAWTKLDKLVQRFEVSKRVHDEYTERWRPVDKAQFHCMPAYVELAETYAWAYAHTNKLTYLNVLLKILDTLSTLFRGLSKNLQARVIALFELEAAFVDALEATSRKKTTQKSRPLPPISLSNMDMSDVIFLACPSARSRTYLQALCEYGMAPQRVLLMGEEIEKDLTCRSRKGFWNGIFLPDLQQSISDICYKNNINLTVLPDKSVHGASTLAAMSTTDAKYVIYSGFGGEIVSPAVIEAAPPMLHMHSGWLPDYRGSTAFYYAMLNHELPSVSAIFLDTEIDTGPVLKRQSYPLPEPGMDVDMVYDPAIRADLMCRVLPTLLRTRNVNPELIQNQLQGTVYYEIHPILKHIAILSLGDAV